MGELARKLKAMRAKDDAAQAAARAEGAKRPKAVKPGKQCGFCGNDVSAMDKTDKERHTLECGR
ncbi:MAG: hypothetical protein HMLIMOIP_002708 [Candidatus Nitrosomirales archaeon]|jgi:hypothetical protein